MHRFGRSAQQNMKDRWGGGFILATILALAGAWYLGGYISKQFGPQTAASDVSNGMSAIGNVKAGQAPHEFQLYFVQVGALRSEAGASKLARTLSQNSLTAMVATKTSKELHPVVVGPFTSMTAAEDAKAKLTGEYQGAFSTTVTVAHNPDSVPAAAMTTKAGADVRKGLDELNMYLYQAAVWMENRSAATPADASNLAALGQQLAARADALKAEKDAKVVEFVKMISAASAHATQIQAAAAAMSGGDEYQAALNGYMSLLDQYRSFHNGN
ncbi:MAG: hypothetical protein JWN15_1165 [Firmicutes bacterium]|jgi:hypothetical protein|nr:hypothetical protein [Bacillota bacterium]